MPDEVKPEAPAPVSPTGQPLISPKLAPYLFAATTLCAIVAGASQLDLGLPPRVFGWAMIGATFFGAMLAATPGFRKTAPMALLVLSLGLGSCAHAPTTPLIVSGEVLDGAGITFEAVAAGMQSLSDAHELTRERVLAWNDFLERWRAGYHSAAKAWRAARGADGGVDQAEAVLTSLLSELATWQFVVAGIRKQPPHAYELPREPPFALVGGASW
jgi:hypothetical protein